MEEGSNLNYMKNEGKQIVDEKNMKKGNCEKKEENTKKKMQITKEEGKSHLDCKKNQENERQRKYR